MIGEAETEAMAVLMAKEEMGSGAVVLNIKTIKHRGISRLFKKNIVEVTAALEENNVAQQQKSINVAIGDNTVKNMDNHFMEPSTTAIEEKLNSLQSMLETRMKTENKPAVKNTEAGEEVSEEAAKEANVNIKFIKLIYNQLIDNEVDEKHVNQIIGEIQSSLKKESTVDSILAAVYQKIILKIGQPKAIELEEGRRKIVFFCWTYGSGKDHHYSKTGLIF